LEYPKDINEDVPDGFLKQVPKAVGLSGGGIWKVNPRADGIWSPDAAQLVAIQYSWSEVDRWLRGTLIREWLQMLRADLPELATVIDPVGKSDVKRRVDVLDAAHVRLTAPGSSRPRNTASRASARGRSVRLVMRWPRSVGTTPVRVVQGRNRRVIADRALRTCPNKSHRAGRALSESKREECSE